VRVGEHSRELAGLSKRHQREAAGVGFKVSTVCRHSCCLHTMLPTYKKAVMCVGVYV
jgi:hypothetical protein